MATSTSKISSAAVLCAHFVVFQLFINSALAIPAIETFDGTFRRVAVFSGDANECPETIQLRNLGESNELVVPLNNVLFDGETCTRDDDLNLGDSVLNTNLQFFASDVTITEDRLRRRTFNELSAETEFLVARDPAELKCNPGPELSDPFFLFLVDAQDSDITILNGVTLESGVRNVLWVADDDDRDDDDSYGCLYSAPATTPSIPTPDRPAPGTPAPERPAPPAPRPSKPTPSPTRPPKRKDCKKRYPRKRKCQKVYICKPDSKEKHTTVHQAKLNDFKFEDDVDLDGE